MNPEMDFNTESLKGHAAGINMRRKSIFIVDIDLLLEVLQVLINSIVYLAEIKSIFAGL